MAFNCTFMRIDTRLIHGQMCIKWSKYAQAKNIIIVDDWLAKDAFMSKFYKQAAPKTFGVEIYTAEDMFKKYSEGTLPDGNALVLFKDATNCHKLWKTGFPFTAVDIGNQASKPGKKAVLQEVFLFDEEFQKLKEMHDAGVEVYIQIIPENSKIDFPEIAKKMQ